MSNVSTRIYANGTSLSFRLPFGIYQHARVMCPDGIVRGTHRISEPDTFFSIPCAVKAKGKTVSGFITITDDSCFTTTEANDSDNPDQTLMFHPQGKNADVFKTDKGK